MRGRGEAGLPSLRRVTGTRHCDLAPPPESRARRRGADVTVRGAAVSLWSRNGGRPVPAEAGGAEGVGDGNVGVAPDRRAHGAARPAPLAGRTERSHAGMFPCELRPGRDTAIWPGPPSRPRSPCAPLSLLPPLPFPTVHSGLTTCPNSDTARHQAGSLLGLSESTRRWPRR